MYIHQHLQQREPADPHVAAFSMYAEDSPAVPSCLSEKTASVKALLPALTLRSSKVLPQQHKLEETAQQQLKPAAEQMLLKSTTEPGGSLLWWENICSIACANLCRKHEKTDQKLLSVFYCPRQ